LRQGASGRFVKHERWRFPMKVQITVIRTPYRVVLKLRWPGDNYREARAESFRIAAVLEERAGAERWVTVLADGIEAAGRGVLGGFVGLELAEGSPDEADRAEALLRAVAAEWQSR